MTNIIIDIMKEQHNVLLEDAQPGAVKDVEPEIAAPEKDFGFVAVAAGEGFHAVLRDLGADRIISGGQTMNPSTEDILSAINKTPAATVFVLPNNKNIIMAAEQCMELTEKKVIVLPTKTVPQGIVCLFAFDPTGDEQTNVDTMTGAISQVTTMSVTYAARDSVFDGMEIKKGDYLGMVEGKVLEAERSLKACVEKMAGEGLKGGETYVNIFYGEGVTEKQAETVSRELKKHLPQEAEVNIINGGQPVYYFIISAE